MFRILYAMTTSAFCTARRLEWNRSPRIVLYRKEALSTVPWRWCPDRFFHSFPFGQASPPRGSSCLVLQTLALANDGQANAIDDQVRWLLGLRGAKAKF
jgi:hypothetical protein